MIVFSSVSKSFGGHRVLDDVSLRIDPGEFIFITGPSGAGKSTLIHLLIRADTPTGGKIEVDGADIAAIPRAALQLYRRRTGVVFQDYKLLDDRTVEENVSFAMEVCSDPDELIARRMPLLLKRLGLTERAHAFPHELSGGEQARCALARALVHHPLILICDEPTGNIDPKQSMELLELLKQVHKEGTTVIVASHDQVLVDAIQTRVVRLQDGKIVRDSVGGYESGREHVDASGERRHKIFDHAPVTAPGPVAEESITVDMLDGAPMTEGHTDQAETRPRTDEGEGSAHVRPIAV